MPKPTPPPSFDTPSASEKTPKPLHADHRERLRQRFLSDGGQNMHDHELLELLLFYSRKRINTNPLAHQLIDRFGSLQGVLEASCEELLSCPQMGENTAVLLKLLPCIFHRYTINKRTESPIIYDDVEKLGAFFISYFTGRSEELFAVALFNNKNAMIDCKTLSSGSVNACTVGMNELAEFVFARRASGIVIAHNHPDGFAVPSVSDLECTMRIKHFFETAGIRFMEHILVADEDYRPILRDAIKHHLLLR